MSNPIPWRSHYRALLREISYLPDPVANRYMAQYVTSRFRKFISVEQQLLMDSAKIGRLHTRIRRNLRLLKLANEGYQKPLERVILMSYGRIGRRKRLLLRPLLNSEVDAVEAGVAPFSAEWKPSPLLLALLQSQSENREVGAQRVRRPVKAKDLSPTIPEFNVFSKPLAEVRKINIRHRWYAAVLDKAFPPLPRHDWETLQSLVDGSEPWVLPKRRKGPQPNPATESDSQPQENFLSAEFLVDGATKDATFAKYVRGRPHHITRRFMRHIWERICALTPRTWWDASENKWRVTWGMRRATPVIYRQLDPVKGMALFEGPHPVTGKIPIRQNRPSIAKEGGQKPTEALSVKNKKTISS
ncbi:uncharacterized protein GIQ15_02005 [Arthroderma uncinatum]|uniref:uncharacterized protein n=1 Tax=Arthroderma uncinatum TaxID=74035 RepID=UPI00144AD0F3|nr:uncharacterized protein GIQ15_02005 [Arthroderma uncinatum]KAF3482681.1 hypothetical protein GIQ15_02005 [Arthroderma uncinatum]